ncbi:hypothetical protein BX600DRAFT_493758 [Xylariales sp. PMI_506]|nr:hypothetical protein BX600DRAFT_493758 [Xylariales sp. PMI_506]
MDSFVLYREGGLEITDRDLLKPIPDGDWESKDTHDVQCATLVVTYPLRIEVSKLKLDSRDNHSRRWSDSQGQHHTLDLAPYAVKNLEEAKCNVGNYLFNYGLDWAKTCNNHWIQEVVRLYQLPRNQELLKYQKVLERMMAYNIARGMKTSSSYLIGDHPLKIDPLPEDAKTLPGRSPTPRVISAQIDAIIDHELKVKIVPPLYKSLAEFAGSHIPQDVYVAYVCVGTLLCGTREVIQDFKRRKEQYSVVTGAETPKYVEVKSKLDEELHLKMNVMVAEFGPHFGNEMEEKVLDSVEGARSFFQDTGPFDSDTLTKLCSL